MKLKNPLTTLFRLLIWLFLCIFEAVIGLPWLTLWLFAYLWRLSSVNAILSSLGLLVAAIIFATSFKISLVLAVFLLGGVALSNKFGQRIILIIISGLSIIWVSGLHWGSWLIFSTLVSLGFIIWFEGRKFFRIWPNNRSKIDYS